MSGITPIDIFPLNYPSGDTTIPARGAKAVPFILDWSKDNQYDANLLQVRDQKFFGSLRCLWIDASECIQNFTVAVNGTEQIFTVVAGTSTYYPVINLNVPVITFSMAAKEVTLARIICLNFVPSITTPSQITFPSSIAVSGNVAVTNFPSVQNVDITGQSGSIDVTVSNFPATQPISGSVSVSNFPASYPVTGTVNTYNVPFNLSASGLSLSTTPLVYGSSSGFTKLRYAKIDFFGVTSAAANNIQLLDGAGNTILLIPFPAIASSFTQINFLYSDSLNITMNNVSAGCSAKTSNVIAGSIFMNIGFSN